MEKEPMIAGVKRGKPMSFEEAGRANPKRGAARGYSYNCQVCVPVFEARLRGYNVTAKPYKKNSHTDMLARDRTIIWFFRGTKSNPYYDFMLSEKANTPKRYLKYISTEVKQGERYQMEYLQKGKKKNGHTVNLDRNERGELRIKDSQRGENEKNEWIGEKEILEYMQGIKFKKKVGWKKVYDGPKLLRIDDKDFNIALANEVMEAVNGDSS